MYKTHYPINMNFVLGRDVHLMQTLNVSMDSKSQTKNKMKNSTIERQHILRDEGYIHRISFKETRHKTNSKLSRPSAGPIFM